MKKHDLVKVKHVLTLNGATFVSMEANALHGHKVYTKASHWHAILKIHLEYVIDNSKPLSKKLIYVKCFKKICFFAMSKNLGNL